MKFEQLGLAEPILRAVAAEGYTTPTPIQIKAIPHVLEGSDLLGCAQTGTGKTAAFALPILHKLAVKAAGSKPHTTESHAGHAAQTTPATHAHNGHAHNGHNAHAGHSKPHAAKAPQERSVLRALILCPTRELASQIGDSFRVYGRFSHLKHTVIFGGVNQHHQVRALRTGVDVLIATPGRLLDLMQQGFADLSTIQILVLDEADRMLDMGFIPDIRRIVKQVPAKRQTLLFSATMPADIRALADSILHKPVSVQVSPVASTVETVSQSVYHVPRKSKPALLATLLKREGVGRTLVFTRTKHGADKVVRGLVNAGIKAEAIHGNKSQNARTRALTAFKGKTPPVLVATDIASRGIDVDEITHVINFDIPHEPETYVHRIGRTARAGASGMAISFCDVEERGDLKAIERLTRVQINVNRDVPDLATEMAVAAAAGHDHADRHSHSGGDRASRHRSGGGHRGPGGHTPSKRSSSHAKSSTHAQHSSHSPKREGSHHATGSGGSHHGATAGGANARQSFGQRGRGRGRSGGKAW